MLKRSTTGDLGGRDRASSAREKVKEMSFVVIGGQRPLKATLHPPHLLADQRRGSFCRRISPKERKLEELSHSHDELSVKIFHDLLDIEIDLM